LAFHPLNAARQAASLEQKLVFACEPHPPALAGTGAEGVCRFPQWKIYLTLMLRPFHNP
jgi:hypothetical protein